MRIGLRFVSVCAFIAGIGDAGAAHAARAVVLPVRVQGGELPPEPLVKALAAGLQGPDWTVSAGDSLARVTVQAGLPEADLARLHAAVDAAAAQLARGAAVDAVLALEPLRVELVAAAKARPRGEDGQALAFRAAALQVTALLAANQPEKARNLAAESALQMPGRKADGLAGVSAEAVSLLAAPAPGGVTMTLEAQPASCQIVLDGTPLGTGSASVQAQPGAVYWAEARCPDPFGTTVPKRVVFGKDEAVPRFVLDAKFEHEFQALGGNRLEYVDLAERKRLESERVRRLADRFDADMVVLVSVGTLNDVQWLNARQYLRSGFSNRQGFVRFEDVRATNLGSYLLSGKRKPGVLDMHDLSTWVREATAKDVEEPAVNLNAVTYEPWYKDTAGLVVTGLGVTSIGLGLWGYLDGTKKIDAADVSDGHSLSEGTSRQQWGLSALIGGTAAVVLGVTLLAMPDAIGGSEKTLSFVPLPGGGAMGYRGRF